MPTARLLRERSLAHSEQSSELGLWRRWTSIPASLLTRVVEVTALLLATPPASAYGTAALSVLTLLGEIEMEGCWLQRWVLTLPRRKVVLSAETPHSTAMVRRLVAALGAYSEGLSKGN